MVDFQLGGRVGENKILEFKVGEDAGDKSEQPQSLVCSGPVSNFSYDSHIVTRRRMEDEFTKEQETKDDRYTKQEMDLEIQRVARELYKALSGLNEEFENAKDQIVIDDLTTHTDTGRQEMIHPYKTLYGRDLNQVLRDNLGDDWDEACATLMTEMRMYELECLRRRMEDEAAANAMAEAASSAEKNSLISSNRSTCSVKSGQSGSKKRNGAAGPGKERRMRLEEMVDEAAKQQIQDEFTGYSCLLVTWKSNPEVEQFKELYMEKDIKTHKRKGKALVDPGDLVSEKSLKRVYKILGQGNGVERLLVKNPKKPEIDEVDGEDFKYFLLAGTSHPYPEDTFYSVGRVPRKLLLKYLGMKMYLVRLKKPPAEGKAVTSIM
ncbi:uncharacterized protein LOC111701280 isoform X2 [Eurytemora carolleeae]|uniref:uncharacterized protein LOC111701280 isoform X2 n=1 Tax=Eurytemora carolleeae TaxID=1294199 RepID=UPI000C75FF63|nr:uncharacterized protein LOC111701280 isoform X2 [Eurytemora carolleeae]|eukprot:XP_023328245.1 uncharacterized protein LOC111701280 isoform X2 [Eurytemora affinis]